MTAISAPPLHSSISPSEEAESETGVVISQPDHSHKLRSFTTQLTTINSITVQRQNSAGFLEQNGLSQGQRWTHKKTEKTDCTLSGFCHFPCRPSKNGRSDLWACCEHCQFKCMRTNCRASQKTQRVWERNMVSYDFRREFRRVSNVIQLFLSSWAKNLS